MRRSTTVARPLTRSERANSYRWLRRVKELVRARHRLKHDDHLVRGDDDLSEAIVDYSSIAYYGWTWPGEELLAEILNESDRNIRKRVARLRKAKLLVVISPSDGWHSNRYIPMLDGRPLFEVALSSRQVRDAIAALRRNDCNTGTPVPSNTRTPVPPQAANVVQVGQNARSAEPSRNNLQEGDSPSPCPTPKAPMEPRREGEMLGPELREATATAPPEPGLEPHGPSEQPTPPNGCPSGLRAQPARAKRALAPVVEFGFTRLMRVYRHPRGGVDRPAYEPHARGFWGKLTPKQKHDAVCAAPYAPGKQWLGYWLDSGRETGKFEIVEQSAAAPRVWVRKDTPQWAAWVADGRCPLTTQHRVDGELETGWMFESEWPPNFNFVQRDGGVA